MELKTAEDLESYAPSGTLLEIIQDLSLILTSPDLSLRQKGLSFLVNNLPGTVIQTGDLRPLLEFFTSKAKDHHSLYPHIISALSILLLHPELDTNSLAASLRLFFNDIQVQSQVTSDRYKFFELMYKLLMARVGDIMGIMDGEFLMGYLLSVEGETDPKSLFLIFNTWPILLGAFDITNLVEDIFDVFACYFPIQLRAGSDCNSLEKSLSISLRSLLSSTAAFAPLAMPLILEKLNSEVSSTQEEVLQTYINCLKTFEAPDLSPHLKDTWAALKKDLLGFRKNGGEIEARALELLSLLSARLQPHHEIYTHFLRDVVWFDIKEYMSSDTESVCKIVQGLCTDSSVYILKESLPYIIKIEDLPSLCGIFVESKAKLYGSLSEISVLRNILLDKLSTHENIESGIKALVSGGIWLFISEDEPAQKNLIERLISSISTTTVEDPEHIPFLLSILSKSSVDLCPILSPKLGSLAPQKRISFIESLLLNSHDSLYSLLSSHIIPLIDGGGAEEDQNAALGSLFRLCESSNGLRDHLLTQTNLYKRSLCLPNHHSYELISSLSTGLGLTDLSCSLNDLPAPLIEAQWRILDPAQIPNMSELPMYKAVMSMKEETSIHILRLKFSFLNKVPYLNDELYSAPEDDVSIPQLTWYTRAFLLRGSKFLARWMEALLVRCESTLEEVMGTLLLHPSEDLPGYKCLSVSPLYRQRLYSLTFEPLLKKYRSTTGEAYLGAILIQLPSLPLAVIQSDLSELSSLIQESLTRKGSRQAQAGLMFASLLLSSPDSSALLPLADLLPGLCELTTCSSMKSRLLSIECLEKSLPLLEPLKESLAYRERIMRTLDKALLDPKRLVRKAAVSAKNSLALMED